MKGRIKTGINILLLFPLVLMISCNSSVLFTDTAIMPDNRWALSNALSFPVSVNDTINTSDIVFTIRTGSQYPFRNIYLFVTAFSPDGKSRTDTLEYDLADEKGNWYGKGFGEINELVLPYRNNVFFPMKGSYLFKIQHGMRIGELPGVYDFGMKIKKHSVN